MNSETSASAPLSFAKTNLLGMTRQQMEDYFVSLGFYTLTEFDQVKPACEHYTE